MTDIILKQSENEKIKIIGNSENDADGYMENLQMHVILSQNRVHISVTGLAAGWNHGFDTKGCWIALSLFGMPKAFNNQQDAAEYIWVHRHEIISQVMRSQFE